MLDKKVIEEISAKYYKDIYSYCLSHLIGSATAAEDITQEVFLLLQQKSETLENRNIKSWLFKTAEYKCYEYYRAQKKDSLLIDLDDKAAHAYNDDDVFMLFDECFKLSDEDIEKYKTIVLKSLTKKEQELYNKIYIDKKSYKEIANELNTTEKAINLRAFRLRKKISTLAKLMLTSIGQFIIKIFF